jgi:hypothetical protein
MWSSTEVHILKPKQDWKQMIAGWLVPGKWFHLIAFTLVTC